MRQSALSSAWLLAGLSVGLVTVTLLGGCASESKTVSESQDVAKTAPSPAPPPPEPTPPPPPPPPPVVQEMAPEPAAAPVTEDPLAWAASLEDVYFGFDKSTIRKSEHSKLDVAAKLLTEDGKRKVVVEGHCDERGTAQYNMALGERRARSVRDYLVKAGVSGSQVDVVSYGKERPQCSEASDECFQYNRRAHFAAQ